MFNGQERTVLLVEDEAVIALSEKATLEKQGLNVVIAYDGEKAIELATNGHEIDLILMDINLGSGVEGTEAAAVILRNHDLPIVFLTSHSEEEMVRKVKGITRYGYVLKNSGEFVLVEAIQSALELFDAKQELQGEINGRRLVEEHHRALANLAEREARYRALVDSLPNGMIALVDSDMRFVEVGGSALENGPLTADDFLGKRLRDIYPPEIADRDEPSLEAALDGETRDQIVEHGGRFYRVITAPVGIDAHVQYVLVLTQDITDSQTAIIENKEIIEKLDLAIETAGLGIWSLEVDSQRLVWNDRMLEIYGLTRSEFEEDPDVWRAMVHAEDRVGADKELEKIGAGQRVQDVSFRIRRPDGEIRHISASGAPISGTDGPKTLIGINVDVTETVRREEELSQAVSMQETLMREASHRIKNSLMTARALISLAENTEAGFRALTDQIDAIAAVHDTLGQAETFEQIDIASLLETITQPFAKAVRHRGGRFNVDCQTTLVDARIAVPVALVINELVSNAIRHGVGERTDGYVSITSRPSEDGLLIAVENDGTRFPTDTELSNAGSLGWKIIRQLAGQIGATVKIKREPHTLIELDVPDVGSWSRGSRGSRV